MTNDLLTVLTPGRPLVVVSPHPDDEVFGCGGIMALAAGRGIAVHGVFCTDGEAIEREPFPEPLETGTDLGRLRRQETREAAELLGSAAPRHLALPDGRLLGHLEDLSSGLGKIFDELSPSLVLAPWPGEQHADHVAASWAATGAALEREIGLAYFEVNTPLCPNAWVDIGAVLEQKRSALMAYHFSLYGQPDVFWDAIAGLNAYRSFFFIRRGWHEAFFVPGSPRDREALLAWSREPLTWEHGCRPPLPTSPR